MYDIPEELCYLSPKKQRMIATICFEERKDAAMNAVVLGLKGLNHVHGFGLLRLSRLSVEWGGRIEDFYKKGNLLYKPYPEGGAMSAGDLTCNVRQKMPDLSESRCRRIVQWLESQRRDAQWNAMQFGIDCIHDALGIGAGRMDKLLSQWNSDIRNFYEEREIHEPRLQKWIEEIGFCFEDGKLNAYRDAQTDMPVKKATAERILREETA